MKVFKVVEDEWVLNGTTRLFGLVIREQARLSAPEGKQLTMTLNGENVPIVPGTYEGDIVLTITDDIPIHAVCDAVFRSALYVEDGKIVPEKSVLAGRDYWLCKKNSPRKVFMFSGKFKNEDQEVHQIIDQLKSSVKKYEQL